MPALGARSFLLLETPPPVTTAGGAPAASFFGPVRYVVDVDTQRDLGFATTLTADVQGVTAAHGMVDSFDEIAEPATLQLTLANGDGRFLPERTDQPYYDLLVPGPLVRLRAIFQDTVYPLWWGRLATLNIDPTTPPATRAATVTAIDAADTLLDAEYKPALAINVRVDQALTDMFAADVAPWPYEDAADAVADYTAFEEGRSILAWVGDNAEQDNRGIVRAQFFVRDLLPAEGGGRFFWDAPANRWAFHNREHDLDSVVTTTLTGADLLQEECAYVFGDRLTNRVSYDVVPRRVGAAGSVIYTRPSLPWAVGKKNLINEWSAGYIDPAASGARVGAIDVIPPVAGTDYSATDELPPHPAGSDDRTDRLTVTVTAYADRADHKLESSENSTIYVRAYQLRGTPLYTEERLTVTEEDTASIHRYGLHTQPSTLLPNVDDPDFARLLARWALIQFGAPFAYFRSVTFLASASDDLRAAALARRIGDRIHIAVAHLNHARDYVIVGIQHRLDTPGGAHRCTWTLRPLTGLDWLILDDDVYGLLDGDNRLIL